MGYNVLILGASYGSLLSTKLLMAGHNVTLVCLPEEAELINDKGTIVRIKLRDDNEFKRPTLKITTLSGLPCRNRNMVQNL